MYRLTTLNFEVKFLKAFEKINFTHSAICKFAFSIHVAVALTKPKIFCSGI